jgi:hypothetical protein
MTKYFRIALTSAMLGAFALPAIAQTDPAPVGEMAPAASAPTTDTPDVSKPDAGMKSETPSTAKKKVTHKHHHVASKHVVTPGPSTSPST